jgi:mRNA interferase MazF
MKKDYKKWTAVKSEINDNLSRPPDFHIREVWICNIGENIGFEEDGKGNRFNRPVLVLRKFANLMCYVIPLSTTKKRGYFYFPFDAGTGKTSVALLSQVRVIDSSRLVRKIGMASKTILLKSKTN